MKPERISLRTFGDERGSFQKAFDESLFPDYQIRQINQVRSGKGVLRGLHFQEGEFAESKIFSVLSGTIQLVTFSLIKQKAEFHILENRSEAIRVPRGFATGYLVLSEEALVQYFSDNIYKPEAEKGIRWNDPLIKSEWLTDQPILSEKDQNWPDFE